METAVYRAYSSSSDEEAHPVTKMLEQQAGQRKRDRSRTPKQQPAKRARQEKAAERQVVVLDGSEEEEAADQAAVPRSPEALVPVGVTVLDEGAAAVDPSLQRRAPRYFDDDFMETAVKTCHRCGEPGHLARDCTATIQRACPLCAGFGHSKRDCPNTLCFKCQQPGHIARDCPNKHQAAEDLGTAVCLRCGQGSCPAAGVPDFHRAEGACEAGYSRADLSRVRCCICYHRGHLCCRPLPRSTAPLTCYNCGQTGHSGDKCFQDATGAARNERLYGSMRSRTSHSQGQYRPQQQQQQQQHYQHDDRFGRNNSGWSSPGASHASHSNGWLPHGAVDQRDSWDAGHQPRQGNAHGHQRSYGRVVDGYGF